MLRFPGGTLIIVKEEYKKKTKWKKKCEKDKNKGRKSNWHLLDVQSDL